MAFSSTPSANPISDAVQRTQEVCSTAVSEHSHPVKTQDLSGLKHFLSIFGATFVTVFFAELGDKTQLTTLLMSAQTHAPWVIFVGAGSALVLTSVLGVLLGQWLSQKISPQTLQKASGLCLLVIAVGLFWDALNW